MYPVYRRFGADHCRDHLRGDRFLRGPERMARCATRLGGAGVRPSRARYARLVVVRQASALNAAIATQGSLRDPRFHPSAMLRPAVFYQYVYRNASPIRATLRPADRTSRDCRPGLRRVVRLTRKAHGDL
ncbi:MAG: hypothetical protein RBS80_00740 [Thermoguttaceae bacterium]|nr:hypothetical protein [Thermoguttaceae bacterium]